jgi:hypothetical protein
MYIKTVTRPKEVIDTDQLKVGMKIHYAERLAYTPYNLLVNDDEWDDEGDGIIDEVNEDYIYITYDGYYPNSSREISVKQFSEDIGRYIKLDIIN